jgi:hypothetical protein
MNPYAYVTFSWLLANLFHPGLFYAGIYLYEGGDRLLISEIDLQVLVLFGALGFVFSLLPLLFSFLAIGIVTNIKAPISAVFMIWLGVSFFSITSGLFVLSAAFTGSNIMVSGEQLVFCIPAMVSVLVANLILFPHFKKMVGHRQEDDSSQFTPEN